jgi:tetratricopeptide (TPR) repeat protein
MLDLASGEAYQRARAAATKAVALDEDSARGHVASGNVYEMGWDLSAAQREFQRAIQLDPNQSYAHLAYGYVLVIMLKPDEGLTELTTAQSLDPVSHITGVGIVTSLIYSRKYEEAIAAAKQWLQLYPDSFLYHTLLGDAYVQNGMESLAVREYLKAEELVGSAPSRIVALQKASLTSGLRGFWKKKLAMDKDPRSPHFSSYDVADDYAALSDLDNCFIWLQKAFTVREPRLIELSCDPRFDGLRSDPRFQDLLRRIGLPSSSRNA